MSCPGDMKRYEILKIIALLYEICHKVMSMESELSAQPTSCQFQETCFSFLGLALRSKS